MATGSERDVSVAVDGWTDCVFPVEAYEGTCDMCGGDLSKGRVPRGYFYVRRSLEGDEVVVREVCPTCYGTLASHPEVLDGE